MPVKTASAPWPKIIVIGILLSAVVGAILWSASAAGPRLIAIGDIHGDFDAFAGILQKASLIDANRHWSGKNATLVQTGDFLDRGPKTRAVMDLLMELQKDAPRQGGRAIITLGNHETMNIFGDLRYVTDADYASYTDDKSERRRASAYEAYAALTTALPKVSRDEWMKAHPAGFIEQREAMSPGGKYGKWLRTLPAVVKVNDSIFLHGGIKPDVAVLKLEQMNDRIADEIKVFDACEKYMVDEKIALPFFNLNELTDAAKAALKDTKDNPDRKKFLEAFLGYPSWLSINPDGPLWFRGYAQWSDDEGAPQIKQLTQTFGVARFVVGHTPQIGQITPRFGGQVYLIDTGMLSSYFEGGRASALEILDGKITPIY
jgi:hypothetical protein